MGQSFDEYLLRELKNDPAFVVHFIKDAIAFCEAAGTPEQPDIAYLLVVIEQVLKAHGKLTTDTDRPQ